jgi:DNA-binding MarR family transcriptional regulator
MQMQAEQLEPGLALELTTGLEGLIGLFRSLSSPNELSLTAVATLATLQRSGPQRLTWLAASEGVTQPGMTQLVSRLQEAGLLERVADPADRRAVQVRLTDSGRAALTRRRAARAAKLTGLLERLTAEQRAALASAVPVIDALNRLLPSAERRSG